MKSDGRDPSPGRVGSWLSLFTRPRSGELVFAAVSSEGGSSQARRDAANTSSLPRPATRAGWLEKFGSLQFGTDYGLDELFFLVRRTRRSAAVEAIRRRGVE